MGAFKVGVKACIVIWAVLGGCGAVADTILTTEDYDRAAHFVLWNKSKLTRNVDIAQRWIGDTDEFWYQRQFENGKKFVIINAASGDKRPAFDHGRVAHGLSELLHTEYQPEALPFTAFEVADEGRGIVISVAGKRVECALKRAHCEEVAATAAPRTESVSPDGRWAVFVKDHNLWVRDQHNDEERALTTDGDQYFAYAVPSETNQLAVTTRRMRIPLYPRVVWSPDSKRLITYRLDERQVADLHLLEYAPSGNVARPVLHTYRYAMAGDEHIAQTAMVTIDIENGQSHWWDLPPVPVPTRTALEQDLAWWHGPDTVYFIFQERGAKILHLYKVNPVTGAARKVLTETGSTFVEFSPVEAMGPNVVTLSNGDIVWYSQRDGWGHLYLYDDAGTLKRQLTRGEGQVSSLLRVDEANGWLYFTARGLGPEQDPYFTHVYRVQLDVGGRMENLTPEPGDHLIAQALPLGTEAYLSEAPGPNEHGFSPSGKYFVSTYSRLDVPETTTVRAADGSNVHVVEQVDIAPLLSAMPDGLPKPEAFEALAADGRTKIYGNILRPSDFDPGKRYPVADDMYPGPQAIRSKRRFTDALFDGAQAMAELGFMVVTIDGRGTPFRSKAFHDFAYQNLQSAGGLEDHIAVLEQLAIKYPQMDLDRVGAYGFSGGGQASTRAILTYPDFYKVAWSGGGNHDSHGYIPRWAETYQGPYSAESYEAQITSRLAGNLKGRLMLVHGLLDDNVHPALTLQVAEALIKANKSFDMLMMPGLNHRIRTTVGYYHRRQWDYFVEHLIGAVPPRDYELDGPYELSLKAAAAKNDDKRR